MHKNKEYCFVWTFFFLLSWPSRLLKKSFGMHEKQTMIKDNQTIWPKLIFYHFIYLFFSLNLIKNNNRISFWKHGNYFLKGLKDCKRNKMSKEGVSWKQTNTFKKKKKNYEALLLIPLLFRLNPALHPKSGAPKFL